MKQFTATIFCVMYMVASSGTTINMHYCMGKFVGWDAQPAVKACTGCTMLKKEKKDCCKDVHTTFQLRIDHLTTQTKTLPAYNGFVFSKPSFLNYTKSAVFYNDETQLLHVPPLLQQAASIIFNCIFRI